MCSDLIAPIITKFANASIHSKCCVSDWKLSRVTPIYKGKGNANDKGNYRPISVIGHIAKIIDHEITNPTGGKASAKTSQGGQNPVQLVKKRRFMSTRKCHLNDWWHRLNASAIFTSI